MKRLIVSFIYLYRWLVSPFLPPSCRFTPTCSRYAISAIECHGVTKGLWMTVKRLMRCNPFNKSNSLYDPVPLPNTNSAIPFPVPVKSDSSDTTPPANISRSLNLKRVHNA